jgi:hypothetical protein
MIELLEKYSRRCPSYGYQFRRAIKEAKEGASVQRVIEIMQSCRVVSVLGTNPDTQREFSKLIRDLKQL